MASQSNAADQSAAGGRASVSSALTRSADAPELDSAAAAAQVRTTMLSHSMCVHCMRFLLSRLTKKMHRSTMGALLRSLETAQGSP